MRADLAVALADATLTVKDLPVVEGDPVQLRAVMQNLVANSAKFTRPGEPARIEVQAGVCGDRWRIEDVEGHGIGLATVRRIVEAHRGHIGIAETDGGGATVWIELPR